MRWQRSWKADPLAAAIADRHYNRQKIGARQFVPPGRAVVLRTPEADALWITSWPFAQFVKHAWAGAWICLCFRNESHHLSSELIAEAVAATVNVWPNVPELGMVTFVDATKVRPKRDPGRCFIRAGFEYVGETKGGLIALQLVRESMPAPIAAIERAA